MRREGSKRILKKPRSFLSDINGLPTFFSKRSPYSLPVYSGFLSVNCLFVCFFYSDVDECAKNPCKNGAKCTNTHGDYKCTCSSAFTGKNCDVGKEITDL